MWWRLEIYVFELIKRARDGERASLPMASQMRISVCSFQFIDTPRPASTKGRWPENKNKKIYKIKNRRTQSHFIYNQSDMDSREKGTNKNISCWIFAYKKNTTTETAEWLMKNQPQNPLDGWKVFFYCSKKFFFFPVIWLLLSLLLLCLAPCSTKKHCHWFMVWLVVGNKRKSPSPLGYVNERQGS